MIKLIFFLFMGTAVMAQTVSTYLDDSSADIDDAMVFDTSGNLYGSNFSGTTVYKITPTGDVSPFVTGLANPNGLAIGNNGNIFINEYSGNVIHKYDPTGTLVESYPVGGSPSGLTKSPTGDIIYTNVSNNSVNILGPDGSITPIFTGSPLNAPVGLAFDETGALYVGNYVGREIYRLVDGNAQYVATVPDGGATDSPYLGFITFGNGKLWGTVLGGHKIFTIDPTGTDLVTPFAGDEQGDMDGPLADATFSYPNGIIFNELENALYISEFSGIGNIRKIDDIPLSLPDFKANDAFKIFPNPSSEFISVPEIDFEILSFSIYDLSGKKVVDHSSYHGSISISKLTAGYYFLEIHINSGERAIQPFIKK